MPDVGHYFAVVRGNLPGQFWLCDDTQIREVAAEAITYNGHSSTVQGDLYYAILTRQDTLSLARTELQTASAGADKDRHGSVDANAEQQAGPLSSEAQATDSTAEETLSEAKIDGGVGTDASLQVPALSSTASGDAEKKSSGNSRTEPVAPSVPAEPSESAGALQSGGEGLRGSRQVDGLLPQAVDPMCSLRLCRDLGMEDPQREFEEHVLAFLNSVKVSSVADALASVPDCSSTLAKLSFGQCLTRLQAGLKAVRESSLTAAEEVDVFTPLWWIADYRLAVYMEAFSRVVALSSTMLLETFKAFASSLLRRKLCVEWSDYTLSHRYWAQVVTDIGTGKSPVMKTVREAFKQSVVSELQYKIRRGPNAVKFLLDMLRFCR